MLNAARTTFIAVLLAAAASTAASAKEPYGTWAMSNGKVTVKVADCGGELCASIVGLKEPISKIDNKPKVDRENPDPGLRKRPLIGLSVIFNMKPAGEGTWKGSIYNPDDGRTYSASLELKGDKMKVKGCLVSVLCKTNNFVRVK